MSDAQILEQAPANDGKNRPPLERIPEQSTTQTTIFSFWNQKPALKPEQSGFTSEKTTAADVPVPEPRPAPVEANQIVLEALSNRLLALNTIGSGQSARPASAG